MPADRSMVMPAPVIVDVGDTHYRVTPRLPDWSTKSCLHCLLEEQAEGGTWRSLGVISVPDTMVAKTIRSRIRAYIK